MEVRTLYQHLPVSISFNGQVNLARYFRPVESVTDPNRFFASFRGRNLSGVVEDVPPGYCIHTYDHAPGTEHAASLQAHSNYSSASKFVRWMWDADPTVRTSATLPRALDTLQPALAALADDVEPETVQAILAHGLPNLQMA